METMLSHLPEHERAYLTGAPRTILDWGCAFGEGVATLARAFPQSRVAGLDSSKTAIDQARIRNAAHEFIWSEDGAIPRDFDVIVTSNCLAHFEAPLAVLEKHLASCKSLYIALVPYNECPLHPQHRSQFRIESFPPAVQSFTRLHAEPLALDQRIWPGQQMLVIYGSENYLRREAVNRKDSMALVVARLVAAQLADRQRAVSAEAALEAERQADRRSALTAELVQKRTLTAEAERDAEQRRALTAERDAELLRSLAAEAERNAERRRADRAEATLRAERERLELLLQIERSTSAELRDRTMKSLQSFHAQFEKQLSAYRSERAWRVMLAIRKTYTLLVRGKFQTTKLDDFEPVFPNLLNFIPAELSAIEAQADTAYPDAAPVENLPEPAPVENLPEPAFFKLHPTGLILSFFALLLREAPDAKEIWNTFHTVFRGNYEAFSTALGKNMEGDDLISLLTLLLIQVARNGVFVPDLSVKMFHAAEEVGVHILPVHFYSPIPNTSALQQSVWSERFDRGWNWKMNEPSQLALLAQLGRFAPELEAIPEEKDGSGFYWNNPAYCQIDATVYYSMIRHFVPALIIEVGAGYSTLIAASACKRNGDTVLEAIDPFPSPLVTAAPPGLTGLVTAPLQKIQLAPFQALGENDILFIDSTHVCKIASDVNDLILSVLPSLKKGVLIHFHDIFLPWNYPRSWLLHQNIFWNEQYLLLAFLLFNDQFEIVLANHFLGREHSASLLRAFSFLKDPGASADWSPRTPSSLWLRRK
jgi:Methyltransferase domain